MRWGDEREVELGMGERGREVLYLYGVIDHAAAGCGASKLLTRRAPEPKVCGKS